MGRIYKYAYCTIAACVSDSSEGGFLGLRDLPKCSTINMEGRDVEEIAEALRSSSANVFEGLQYDDGRYLDSHGFSTTYLSPQSLKDAKLQVLSFDSDWTGPMKTNPLKLRGWALQERHMSTRVIYFTKERLLWECKTLRATEQRPKRNETKIQRILILILTIPPANS
jgi:hypothetical protein